MDVKEKAPWPQNQQTASPWKLQERWADGRNDVPFLAPMQKMYLQIILRVSELVKNGARLIV